MFLIDTNCWMQIARERDRADEVRQLLSGVPAARLFTSIYTVHSLGITMWHRGMIGEYGDFLARTSIGVKIGVVDVPVAALRRVADACRALGLDFDDAYQYVAAELHGLKLVSLDADFDRTPNGRLTPAAALQLFTDEQPQRQQDA